MFAEKVFSVLTFQPYINSTWEFQTSSKEILGALLRVQRRGLRSMGDKDRVK